MHGVSLRPIAKVRTATTARARGDAMAARVLDSVLRPYHERAESNPFSNYVLGRIYGVCDRTVRDYRDGSRNSTFGFILSLPSRLAAEILRAALAEVESQLPSNVSCERAERLLTRDLGQLAEALDTALLDGYLDDGERRTLARLLRKIEARAAGAAQSMLRNGTEG